MTNNFTESHLEQATLELFEELGYETVFAPDIAPDGEYSESQKLAKIRDTLLPKLISGEIRVPTYEKQ